MAMTGMETTRVGASLTWSFLGFSLEDTTDVDDFLGLLDDFFLSEKNNKGF